MLESLVDKGLLIILKKNRTVPNAYIKLSVDEIFMVYFYRWVCTEFSGSVSRQC